MGYSILSDRADSTNMTYPYVNADQDALEGLSLCNQQNNQTRKQAEDSYNHMMKTFWAGNGFADATHANNHVYSVYKLGLALILSNRLGIVNSSLNEQMIKVISTCQIDNGGIRTDYTVNGSSIIPTGQANTETTSIITIANPTIELNSNSPSPTSSIPEFPWLIVMQLFISVLFAAILIGIRKKRNVGKYCNNYALNGEFMNHISGSAK